ncbi:HdrA8: CoB--CoM heterodisulfide reductase, iron-sulfur subunit alpha [Desulfosarcina variabilis str. Montpellier]|uniref:CoB--CoM heterodisulfide reductase iron-sulfur subunit A family protein n=1 Tax=Desulfosarcina variabilis TaxID=2300 RepID=UPI003AFB2E45
MTQEKKDNASKDAKGKVGVYICYCGGNISDHVDVEQVRDRVEQLPEVAVARTNMFMCSDPGQALIMDDLKNGTVDRVVVASCAPSLHETTFRAAIARAGGNPYIYDHANIREQVSWVHHGDKATDKATRLVSMAAAKAEQLKPLEPIRVEARRHATVIGGGVAGLKAAKELADRGIRVVLVEKSPFLGGQLANLDRLAPTGEKAADLIQALCRQVLNHRLITIHACATVTAVDGYVGNFNLEITRQAPVETTDANKLGRLRPADRVAGKYVPAAGVATGNVPTTSETITVETGVVVMATGFKSYRPQPGEYGFGNFKEVITLPDLIQRMAEEKHLGNMLSLDGRPIRSMAMIHCVGSRQIPGIHPESPDGHLNEYCSRTCCSATLNAASTIRRRYPGTRVYECYRDIRTYGRGAEDLYEQAGRNQVVFLRFEAEDAPQVVSGQPNQHDYPLTVKIKDTLTFDEELDVPVDLVVLATGIEANPVHDLVEMMKLPVGMDRFLLEVHPKLRPVELPIAGILLAGTCQAPMDVGEACNAAGAAAVKAAALLGKGAVELDPFVAEVDLSKCQGHGSCVEACLSDGALTMVEMSVDGKTVKRAQVTPALCLGCGACTSVCPENAIEVAGWTLKQYEAMVDRIMAEPEAV